MIISPHIEIIRIEDAFLDGMFGNLLISTRYFCVTMEPPEFDNLKNYACIPAGQYECEKRRYSGFGRTTYEILNVPNRSDVLFHPVNVVRETKACVGLGKYIDRDNAAIRESRSTFTRFMNTMISYPKFRLTIKEVWA